jgi:transcriptional regulator with XRE-family HTH domain
MTSPLKAYRISRLMTQNELGSVLGLSASTISKIESGHMMLSKNAARIFDHLQTDTNGKPMVVPEPLNFERMRDYHMEESDQYLRSHKKDREALLHKYEKQVQGWTRRYNLAMTTLQVAEYTIAELKAKQPDAVILKGYELDRFKALETFGQISAQRPELVIIKIEGLKQELRSTKAMLGKKRQYLGIQRKLPGQEGEERFGLREEL